MPDQNNNTDMEAQTQQIGQMCREFFLESSVHGFRFFAEPKRHWIERVWWVVSCISSMILCGFAVTIIWMRWHAHPVTVTFDDKTTPVAMIPFPAFTVCSTQKYKDRVEVGSMGSVYEPSLLSNDLNKMDAASQICAKFHYQYNGLVNETSIAQNRSIYEAIREISPNRDSLIRGALWLTRFVFVNLKPIFTEEGLCFTYNSMNSEELYTNEVASELKTVRDNPSAAHWNIEDGYLANLTERNVFPHRVFGSGLRDSLRVFPTVIYDDTFRYCQFAAPGFLISLHLPDELPQFSNNYIFVQAGQRVLISVKPNMIATSEGLRKYAPHTRGCYFQSERQLRFFKSYSQSKCELECLANFTKNETGCVRFYMPRDQNTPVCRLLEIHDCVLAERKFTTNLVVRQCDCLPDCTSIGFDTETSEVQYYHSETEAELRNFYNKTKFIVGSDISISFKENQFISMNRSETFTMPDFIASCGGLFGLFMGISMLSVIELIYYFTLRACCRLRRQKRIQGNSQATWAA